MTIGASNLRSDVEFSDHEFGRSNQMNKKDYDYYNELRGIAFSKHSPTLARKAAVEGLLKIISKNLPRHKKVRLLNELSNQNREDAEFTKFLEGHLAKYDPTQKLKGEYQAKEAKLADDSQEIVDKVSDQAFVSQMLAHLKRNLTKSGPWGTKVPENDFLRIQKLMNLTGYGFYFHRNLISDHLLIPYKIDPITKKRIVNLLDVERWKVSNKPILQSFSSETIEVVEARQRYRVITNRLNIEERYLLKELTFDLETTLGNLTLRYDFVGLEKTDLGLKGSWVISILGLNKDLLQTMLDFNWMTLKTFLKNSRISSRGLSTKLLNTTVLIECTTDEEAQKEVGFFLEELLIFINGAEITNFKLNEKKLSPAKFEKRKAQLESLTKRTQWIIKHPRGTYVNNCMVCGKPLSVSISVDRAIGPQCWEKLANDKKIKKIDLKPEYNPLRYEATITKEELLNNLVATFESLL